MLTTGVVGPSEHGSILVTDQDSDQDMNAKILAFCTMVKKKYVDTKIIIVFGLMDIFMLAQPELILTINTLHIFGFFSN